MGLVYPDKDARWMPPKAANVVLPKMLVTMSYEDACLAKLSPPRRAAYDHQFEKIYRLKATEARTKADRALADNLRSKDAKIPNADDPDKAKAILGDIQKDLERITRDFATLLKTICIASVAQAYKETMNGQQLGVRVVCDGNVRINGKVLLKADAAQELEAEANALELATKALNGLVYPTQDFIDGLVQATKAAVPLIDKAIKDSNALSKVMRDQQKKPTPATDTLIKNTQKTLDKTLDALEKLVSGSVTRTRQAKLKLAAIEGYLKPLDRSDIISRAKACAGEAQDILTDLNAFMAAKGIIDEVSKPFDGKHLPEFPKLITLLTRIKDPKASADLDAHVQRLGDLIAEVARG